MTIAVDWDVKQQNKMKKNIAFLSLKNDFVYANSVDPDEMPHHAEMMINNDGDCDDNDNDDIFQDIF